MGASMTDFTSLTSPDILGLVLCHLSRQDGVQLALTCSQAANAYKQVSGTYTPAPRVIVCASGRQQLLVIGLTPEGHPYMQSPEKSSRMRTRSQSSSAAPMQVVDARRGHKQWLTGLALSPYDKALYVSAYHTEAAPPAIQRFSQCRLRPRGQLLSGAPITSPEGLVFAKKTCYVACADTETLVAVGLPHGNIQQTLELEEGLGCPWGMAAWDPSTYASHRLAKQHIPHSRQAHRHQHVSQQQQQQSRPHTSKQGECPASSAATAAAAPPADTGAAEACSSFAAAAASGCLLVAVQQDVHRDEYWQPPEGPPSGGLLCVPLDARGRMLGCQCWSRVGIKRPSGVTIDHQGHVWTTSLERLLLRFAGPAHADSGSLLQQVDLVKLLPSFAKDLHPMDVQAHVQLHRDAAAESQQCLLVVTLHAGPSTRGGAVAVLAVQDGEGSPARVRVVNCWQDRRMQEPNMMVIA